MPLELSLYLIPLRLCTLEVEGLFTSDRRNLRDTRCIRQCCCISKDASNGVGTIFLSHFVQAVYSWTEDQDEIFPSPVEIWNHKIVKIRDWVSEAMLLHFKKCVECCLNHLSISFRWGCVLLDQRSRNFSKSHTPRKSPKNEGDEKIATTTAVLKKGFNGFFFFNLQSPYMERWFSRSSWRGRCPRGIFRIRGKHALKTPRRRVSIIIHVGDCGRWYACTHDTVYVTCHYGTAGVVSLMGLVEEEMSTLSHRCRRLRCPPLARGELVVSPVLSKFVLDPERRFGVWEFPATIAVFVISREVIGLMFLVEGWKRRRELKRVCFRDVRDKLIKIIIQT